MNVFILNVAEFRFSPALRLEFYQNGIIIFPECGKRQSIEADSQIGRNSGFIDPQPVCLYDRG